MPVIDVHSHLFGAQTPLPRAALDDPMWDVSARMGGNFRVRAEANQLPKIEDYLDRMDEWGVDTVIVNNVALTCSGARAMNEYNANFIAQHPGRMLGIAAVPMAEGDAGARELEYAVKELGFVGAKIYPKIQGVALDNPSARALYEAASELDVPVLTHVTSFQDCYTGARGMDWLDHTFDNPMRMFDSGYMRDIANLKFIFAHQAGGFVYYKESILSRKPELEPLFERFYVDISPAVRFSVHAVNAAVEALGADHVLFGIDYPWANLEAAAQCVPHVRNMPIADDLKDAILSGNAIKLLKLDAGKTAD